jgi:hypothetical protein
MKAKSRHVIRAVIVSLWLGVLVVCISVRSVYGQANREGLMAIKKFIGYGPVTMTATGNLFANPVYTENFSNAIVHWVTSGTPSGCTLLFYTGQTAATANLAVNDPNYSITCTSSGQKVVGALDEYVQLNLSALSGGSSPSVVVYLTLTNLAGNALNQTLSTVAQGNGAAADSSPWFVQGTDGSHNMPAGDAQARAINVLPGDGTQAEKQVSDGVGSQGAGVLQTAPLFTLSAAVASSTLTQVVAAPGSGSIYLGAILVEKATASSGSFTVEYGTSTNCGTGTTVLFGPVTVPAVGMMPVGVLVPATKALCLVTDASTTSVRALTQ